jgi:hypothetical protein
MALNPQDKTGKKISLPAPGTVPARVARIVEIGKHASFKYGVKDQVQIWYSLPTRLIADEGEFQGKQHQVRTQRMTKSSNEKAALMKHVKALKPTATSLSELINLPCYITIVNNDVKAQDGSVTAYCNIMGVMPVPEGMQVGDLDTEPFYFDFDNPDETVWTKHLWEGMRETIMKAENYKGSEVEKMVLKLGATA